jgi:hypothetical protein
VTLKRLVLVWVVVSSLPPSLPVFPTLEAMLLRHPVVVWEAAFPLLFQLVVSVVCCPVPVMMPPVALKTARLYATRLKNSLPIFSGVTETTLILLPLLQLVVSVVFFPELAMMPALLLLPKPLELAMVPALLLLPKPPVSMLEPTSLLF